MPEKPISLAAWAKALVYSRSSLARSESRLEISDIAVLLHMNTNSFVFGVFWYWLSELVQFLDGIFNTLLHRTCDKPMPTCYISELHILASSSKSEFWQNLCDF